MQPTIAEQYNEVRKQVIDALLPIGITVKAEDYQPSGTNGNAALNILMTSASGRRVTVSITDISTELQYSYKRTFRLDYEVCSADLVTESGDVLVGYRSNGSCIEELNANERCKYNAGQFLASAKGLQILRTTRAELESRFARLDRIARSTELVATAQRILQADKDQHGTLLDIKERDALNRCLSKRGKVNEDDLQSWITRCEKLQKRALSVLAEQSKDAATQGSATRSQLQQLTDKYAPAHRRAS